MDVAFVLDRRARAVESHGIDAVYAACARVVGVNMLMLLGLCEDGIYSLDATRRACYDLAREFLTWGRARDGADGGRKAASALTWVIDEIILRWYLPSPSLPMLAVPASLDLERMIEAIAR